MVATQPKDSDLISTVSSTTNWHLDLWEQKSSKAMNRLIKNANLKGSHLKQPTAQAIKVPFVRTTNMLIKS